MALAFPSRWGRGDENDPPLFALLMPGSIPIIPCAPASDLGQRIDGVSETVHCFSLEEFLPFEDRHG